MAGTRCANPEYQSEVDAMMLEYVVYKGVEAHLELLTALSGQQDQPKTLDHVYNGSPVIEEALSALRLTETYDTLITLYGRNHDESLQETVQRNDRMLQFLVQLNTWLMSRLPDLEDSIPRMSLEMQDKQKHDTIVNQTCRQIWLKSREDIQDLNHADTNTTQHVRSPQLSLADCILPSFMSVSLDLFEISKTPQISPEWMELAAHLMVQAAIEIMDAPDLLSSSSDLARDALHECFAWGRLEDPYHLYSAESIASVMSKRGFPSSDESSLELAARNEHRYQRIFRENSEFKSPGHGGTLSTDNQTAAWEDTRKYALSDVLMTVTSIQEAEPNNSHGPTDLLRDRYRLTTLLTEVHDFIAIHWKLMHSRKWHGKPILLQIEEGGIDGLTPGQFEEFKNAARIRDMWESALLCED